MIDFRYHIISLISVFLALAVGIVLGAGPLRDYIADELSGQVEELRAEKDVLRAQLERSQVTVEARSEFLAAAAPQLYDDILNGRSVAVVVLPGTDLDVANAVQTRLTQAGATVTGTVAVTERWTDPAESAFRSGIAENLVDSMNPAPADAVSGDRVLAEALGQALTLRDPDNRSAMSAQAEQIIELLGTSGLIAADPNLQGPAYATVVVGPVQPAEPYTDTQAEELAPMNEAAITIVQGVAATGEGSVVVGADAGTGTLLTALRSDAAAIAGLTTVDSGGTVTGQVTVPLALAADIAGNPGQFGLAESADSVIPAEQKLTKPDPAEFVKGPAKGNG